MGIMAFFGIRRHGSKGILGRALVGTTICGLLLFALAMAIPVLVRRVEQAKQQKMFEAEQTESVPERP